METFFALYLIVGIILASYVCGLVAPSIKGSDKIGLVFFFYVVMMAWPMVLSFLAPSFDKQSK